MIARECTLQNYFDWIDRPFLYFLKRIEDGLIKIGWSQNITQRLDALRKEHGPLEILAIIPGGPVAEAAWHDCYKDLRERGEWFRPEEDLMKWLNENKDLLLNTFWLGEEPVSSMLPVEDWLPPLVEFLETTLDNTPELQLETAL